EQARISASQKFSENFSDSLSDSRDLGELARPRKLRELFIGAALLLERASRFFVGATFERILALELHHPANLVEKSRGAHARSFSAATSDLTEATAAGESVLSGRYAMLIAFLRGVPDPLKI